MDIVTQLRIEAGAEDHRGAGGLCRNAAAEIERLRAALQKIADGDYDVYAGNAAKWPSIIAKNALDEQHMPETKP